MGGESVRNTAKNCFYPIKIKNNKVVGKGEVCDDNFHPKKIIKLKKGEYLIYPIDSDGIERKWRYAHQSFDSIKEHLVVEILGGENFDIKIPQIEVAYKTVWCKPKYDAGSNGKKILNNIVPNNDFDFPKSLYNVQDCVKLASNDDSTILDFFSGSGTTAHAIMDLNKSDSSSKRKFILTEMGEHFNTVILPRVKKIAFASEYKKGIAQDNNGIGICVKYYELEQYEQVLQNITYYDVPENWQTVINDIFSEDIFIFDKKLSTALKIEGEKVKIDLDSIYPNIDIKETIFNITGKKVKNYSDEEIEFIDGSKEKTLIILKPLLVW